MNEKLIYSSKERFDVLNSKYLGYGNPSEKINIVYIGIEEFGGWSIKELLPDKKNIEINNFLNSTTNIQQRVYGLLEKFNVDVLQILDNCIYEMDSQLSKTHFIYNAINTNLKTYSRTNNLQFQLSKKIRNLIDKDLSQFATKEGNEVVLNYYPIGRKSEDNQYDELEFFFGLKNGEKFYLKEEDKITRLKLFFDFFSRIKEEVDEKIYLFLMGLKKTNPHDSVCHLLFNTVKKVFELPYIDINELFSLNNSEFKYGSKTYGYSYQAKNINIYFLPHPTNYMRSIENYSDWLNLNES